jgi:hypothetical protein
MSQTPDDSRAEALQRLDNVEHALAELEESVRAAVTRMHGEVARARAAVHDLHASAGAPAPVPADPEPEPEDDGARLVALDLVMRDVPRAEAERQLAESFPGSDAARLLDEAAASLEA